MDRTEYEEVTHHMHREMLVSQYGGREFTKAQMRWLVEVHEGTEAFEEVLNTLMDSGMIESDNLQLKLVDVNMDYHGACKTQKNEGRYYHRVELNSRTIATLLHELGHVFCFDQGLYEDYEDLCDSTAHGRDFDAAMRSLITVAYKGRK